jgi:hypothetical protein
MEKDLLTALEKTYKDINAQMDINQLFYLGMQLDISPDRSQIKISQPGFVQDILAAHPVTKKASSPANSDLFTINADE